MKIGLIIILYLTDFVLLSTAFAQNPVRTPWVAVRNRNNLNVRIDISTLRNIRNDDILVWSLETHKEPIVIDDISKRVFRTKTRFLINKALLKYSILEVVYYDSLNAVIKNFNYSNSVKMTPGTYSYPVLKNNIVEDILLKCIEYIRIKN
ncbi:MAG: hypothetical protein WCJ01_02720 [Ignavibacteria bacterium]